MDRRALVDFINTTPWAVQASVTLEHRPQAAVIGIVATERVELVFDTMADTRKATNLRQNPRIAFVIGWDEGRTVQLEGIADEPVGDELARLKAVYLRRFPDGVARFERGGLTYFRVRPTWVRYSDFSTDDNTTSDLPRAVWSDD